MDPQCRGWLDKNQLRGIPIPIALVARAFSPLSCSFETISQEYFHVTLIANILSWNAHSWRQRRHVSDITLAIIMMARYQEIFQDLGQIQRRALLIRTYNYNRPLIQEIHAFPPRLGLSTLEVFEMPISPMFIVLNLTNSSYGNSPTTFSPSPVMWEDSGWRGAGVSSDLP